ncbi:hypothetical protein BRM14_03045, partial [Xanthomonas oryzae pv. oryzae]
MGSDTDQTQLAVVWRSIGDPCLSALLVSALQCCKAPPTLMPRKRSLALAANAETKFTSLCARRQPCRETAPAPAATTGR